MLSSTPWRSPNRFSRERSFSRSSSARGSGGSPRSACWYIARARSGSPHRSSKSANAASSTAVSSLSPAAASRLPACSYTRGARSRFFSFVSNSAKRMNASAHGRAATCRSCTALARSSSPWRSSNAAYAAQASAPGRQDVHLSNTTRALSVAPRRSSMRRYSDQMRSARGRIATARSSTLRACPTRPPRASNCAYFIHTPWSRYAGAPPASARSYTDRARAGSPPPPPGDSSHRAYLIHSDDASPHPPRPLPARRTMASNRARRSSRCSASSSASTILLFLDSAGRQTVTDPSPCSSRASRMRCSAVSCTGAGALFLTRRGVGSIANNWNWIQVEKCR
ncbi:hypothetical protein DAI22_10g056800 [Oryza sativa Japonica Group]|nr:hypothetical protein DAI22_10g056800 [Oryza sativa Japonica Group]